MTSEPLDLRLLPAALTAWALTALGVGWSTGRSLVGAVLLLVAGLLLMRCGRRTDSDAAEDERTNPWWVATVALIIGSGALAVSGLRAGAIDLGPVPDLADQGAQVEVAGVVTSDPVRRDGDFTPYVLVRLTVTEIAGRGSTTRVQSPVLVIADPSWLAVRLGDQVRTSGRLSAAQGPDLAAVLFADESPEVTRGANWLAVGVSHVRAGIREAASPLGPAERALVPALVDGDDSQMPEDTTADFQTTGLTHLLAVSGTNLTLVLGFLLFLARWCGVRGRGIAVVGVLAVVFFVLLARPEPSVLRAAAMGLVGLAGLAAGGRQRGMRALCCAVVVLVLLDPWLARSMGFLLSTLATGGILLLAPAWRVALTRWMPRILAEAIAVPMAAQLACTPPVAAISGQVSLVAVISNLLAAPAIGPTTVLGLVAGVIAMVSEPVGQLCGQLAGFPAWWIVTVADRTARLRSASVAWPVGPVAISALTLLCLVVVVALPSVLTHRWLCLGTATVLVLTILNPIGRMGWPPDGWLMVMCDVGQGDGIVLNAGQGNAVVVDTGPDPGVMDRCLDDLGIDSVALVVLTHFHADHVDGLAGVLQGRRVPEIEVSAMNDPPDRAAAVRALAAATGVAVTTAVPGEERTLGNLSWRVIGPWTTQPYGSMEIPNTGPNNASVAMLLESSGHRILLTGDAEPEEERDIVASGVDLDVAVLKVSHHGSANQEPAFIAAAGAEIALISVGADNDYGHPAPEALDLLADEGSTTYRTDLDGDIAIVERAGQLMVVTDS